jgi:hypothetical protein
MNIAELQLAVATLTERIAKLEAAQTRDRGPKSEKEMTEKDAFRVKFGDLKDTKHKAAADLLKLSYGQIFSCRGGYTFKQVTKDWKEKDATGVTTVQVGLRVEEQKQ